MGGCISHLKKEMQAPPARPGNWEGLAPQPFEAYEPKPKQGKRQTDGGPVRRFETPSGIEGLTYDQAGRPVWRNPKAADENGAKIEHVESSN